MKPLYFFLASVITGLVIYFLIYFGVQNQQFFWPSLTIEIIILNIIVTSGIYFWLSSTKAPILFMNSYLLSIVMKLIFYTFLLLMIRVMKPGALTENAVLLLVCYFIYTGLEVAVLFRKVDR